LFTTSFTRSFEDEKSLQNSTWADWRILQATAAEAVSAFAVVAFHLRYNFWLLPSLFKFAWQALYFRLSSRCRSSASWNNEVAAFNVCPKLSFPLVNG
jgi:hypothetical protein